MIWELNEYQLSQDFLISCTLLLPPHPSSFSFLIICYDFTLGSSVQWHRRRQWHPTPVLLPGKSHGWRSLVGCSPWCLEESDMAERLNFHFSLLCISEGNGNPLQCSCLENPRDGVAQSRTWLKWLSSSSSSAMTWQSTYNKRKKEENLCFYKLTVTVLEVFLTQAGLYLLGFIIKSCQLLKGHYFSLSLQATRLTTAPGTA